MRIAVAGFYCEANSFSDVVPEASFIDGADVRAAHTGAESALGGYIDYESRDLDFRLDLLGLARVSPGGPLPDAVLDTVLGPLLRGFLQHTPHDGVLLALHGSAMTKERHDVDADLVAAVRGALGPRVPIAVTLDTHANVSPRLAALADIVTLYKTTPHVDQRARGFSTARMLADAVAGRIAPAVSVIKAPVVSGVLHQNSSLDPLRGIMEAARSLEARPGILSMDVALGNAFSDTPNLGMSVVAVSDGAAEPGETAARLLAGRIWAERAALAALPDTIDQLIEKLARQPDGRTLVIDLGDNIHGGASGRSAELFLALTRSGLPNVVAAIYAPEQTQRAIATGIGNRISIDFPNGESCEGNVAAIVRNAPDAAPTAAALTFQDGHMLALSFDRSLTGDPRPLLSPGLIPQRRHVVIVKGDHRSAKALGPLFDRVLWTGTAGATTPWLQSLSYRHRPMPCYPFDSG
jgi:microcystin degradation protein MlrC